MTDRDWHNLGALPHLAERGSALVKVASRAIAIFRVEGRLFAIDNLCPHEGYPLMEGSVKPGCRLACNWHGWTFNLETGEAVVGRDPVRTWPIEERSGSIWIDLTSQPPTDRLATADRDLADAFADLDYDRLARGLARRRAAGGSADEGVAAAIGRTADAFERGFTHAHAGAADWLSLSDRLELEDGAESLVPPLEALGHLAYDATVVPSKPLPKRIAQWNGTAFLESAEAQDETNAIAMVRGAVADAIAPDALFDTLARAALAHYLGFGHGLIYVTKARDLVDRFGLPVFEPVALLLTRYLLAASREDLIPEFRGLAPAIAGWGEAELGSPITAPDLSGLSTRAALEAAATASMPPHALHDALTGAAALNMLRFDVALQDSVRVPVSRTVGWLDFTHAVTFAQAVRAECTRQPGLWPAGLAQLACFVGRNAGFLTERPDDGWTVPAAHAEDFLQARMRSLLNHSDASYIHAVHRLKMTLAVADLLASGCGEETRDLLLAALNRFLCSPIRRKAPLRIAHQALDLVARQA